MDRLRDVRSRGGRGSSFPKALRMYFMEAPNENDLLTLDSENKAIREK